tara:strand:+ start:1804 stop:2601 length:798 start_codon:yes stop_codon:yes gene_type:complete
MNENRSGLRLAGTQTLELTQRSLQNEFRQWVVILPGLIFPLMMAAVYSSQFGRALGLPGFPKVDSFLDFILPGSIVQAVSFGATSAGTALALDIEDGFFDRLMVSPVSRVPILLGRLGGAAVIAAGKAIILILIFLACGARIKSGLSGAVIVTLTASLLVLAIGGLAQSMAIKTRSQEAVGATFPLIFVTIFMSSAFFPTALMDGWFRALAENNPITWTVDPVRRLVIEGWSSTDALQALGVPLLLSVLTISLAIRSLQRMLRSV